MRAPEPRDMFRPYIRSHQTRFLVRQHAMRKNLSHQVPALFAWTREPHQFSQQITSGLTSEKLEVQMKNEL